MGLAIGLTAAALHERSYNRAVRLLGRLRGVAMTYRNMLKQVE